MTDIYSQLAPPKSGDYPDWFKFVNINDSIEGYIADTRIGKPSVAGDEPYPILEIQRQDGTSFSVGCGAAALYRQVYELRPAVGGYIRITFTGFAGQAKLFDVQYQAPAAGAAPAPAPAAPPAAQPEQPFGTPPPGTPAAPWNPGGTTTPAAPVAPPQAPWGPPPAS